MAAAAAAFSSSSSSKALLIRLLYRSLIKAAKPFDAPTPRGTALTCLIHRTGIEDVRWDEFLRGGVSSDIGEDDDDDDDEEDLSSSSIASGQTLFRKLLREVVAGHSAIRQMQFPSQTYQHQHHQHDDNQSRRLVDIIRREFKCQSSGGERSEAAAAATVTTVTTPAAHCHSQSYSEQTRREVAFMALRELNKKLAWAQRLDQKANKIPTMRHPNQAARFVSPLPLSPPSAYLQPGTFLIAHPHLTDYFRRTVICILDHQNDDENDLYDSNNNNRRAATPKVSSSTTSSLYGTYGLIVNRSCTSLLSPAPLSASSSSSSGGRPLTLREVLHPLPSDLAKAFGSFPVREGGPVHMSLQMLHSYPSASALASSPPCSTTTTTTTSSSSDSSSKEDEVSSNGGSDSSSSSSENIIGGHVLPMVPDLNSDQSTAFHSDRAVYYRGDILRAAHAVLSGQLGREDVSFFVGASCWSPGQLEGEIERGFWLPCRGPPEIALSGICDHAAAELPMADDKGKPRPKADLWLSMLSACGEAEAELAHLVWSDDGKDECGDPCDEFS